MAEQLNIFELNIMKDNVRKNCEECERYDGIIWKKPQCLIGKQ
jgi:hypothetical protein